MARPRAKIDAAQVKMLAAKCWSPKEIAVFFGVSYETIHRRFASVIEEGRQSGMAKLRDLQWRRAEEGSDRVLLHMSAHYLGQSQKLELDVGKIPDEVLIQETQRRIEAKGKA